MFERKNLLLVGVDKVEEERLLEIALEAGADDVRRDGAKFEVACNPAVVGTVADAMMAAGVELESQELTGSLPRLST